MRGRGHGVRPCPPREKIHREVKPPRKINVKTTQETTARRTPRFLEVGDRLPKIWKLTRLAFREWWKDDTSRFAAALAFYTLFSLAPVVLIAVGVASYFYVPAQAARDVVSRVQELVGWQGAMAVKQVIDTSNGMGKSAFAVMVGIVTLIFGASVVFGELQAALNIIWDVRPGRGAGMLLKVVVNRIRSFGIALAAGFLMVLSLIANTVIDNLKVYSDDRWGGIAWFWYSAHTVFSFLVVVMLFAMIYKYLPDVRLQWHDVWMGSAVTAVLFVIGKQGIGIYLAHATVADTFGAAGSLAVLLVWVYYSALISFFGAEFTQVYAKQRGKDIKPENHAVRAGRKSAHGVGDVTKPPLT